MWNISKVSWAKYFAVLVTLLCLGTAIAYVIEPYDMDTRATAAHAAATEAGAKGAAAPQGGGAPPEAADRLHDDSRIWYRVLLLASVASGAAWFAYAFTGDPVARRHEQVQFAYFFVIGSFAVLMIPPFVKSQAIGSEPIGIVSGCVPGADAVQLSCNPRATRAGAEGGGGTDAAAGAQGAEPRYNQWLVNIGGALREQAPGECRLRDPADCKPGSVGNRVEITGGVVVPLPFIVIALFGGAISLSRRIPEIQKRSEPGYVPTEAEPAMDMRAAREELVFQIMQFISAPLIAIAAHQVIEPDSQSTAVGLAFLAGFGSESILLMIRGVANGIQPKSTVRRSAPEPAVAGDAPAGAAQAGLLAAGADAPLRLTHGLETDAPADPVHLRLCVEDEGIEPGSLTISVDGRPAAVTSAGCAELELASGRRYRIEARAVRGGSEVRGELALTADDDDDGKPVLLELA